MMVRALKQCAFITCRKACILYAVLALTAAIFLNNGAALAQSVPAPSTPSVSGGVCSPHGCCKCKKGSPRCCPVSCEAPGRSRQAATFIYNRFLSKLLQLTPQLEAYEKDQTDITMVALLTRLNQVELNLIDWWKTLWFFNLRPALQDMTDQRGTALADQARVLASAGDAADENRRALQLSENEAEDYNALGVAEGVCVAAGSAGGLGRASAFSRAMRLAWQNEALENGYNKKGSDGAAGRDTLYRSISGTFEKNFCNKDDNGGRNLCNPASTDPLFFNADTQINKYIYGMLTIPVHEDSKYEDAITLLIGNITGDIGTDPVTISSAQGQGQWLVRRSFLARKAAIRSLPQLMAGWRMPGSRMGDEVKDLRLAAGVPLSEISDNPSYRELMHAVSVDRFNSGQYAAGLITDKNKLEMEKLTLDTFYLMQLRDYYELLERTALTLAVQVSILAETAPASDIKEVRALDHK